MIPLTYAANNDAIGGGEVMLLRMAEAARVLGAEVSVVAPGESGELGRAAVAAGFETTLLPGTGRRSYMRQLRAWDRHRTGILWCNGLVPAVATAGRNGRVVHLHQAPRGVQGVAARMATLRALQILVPSTHMTHFVPGSRALPNWTDDVHVTPTDRPPNGPVRVGYIGRLSQDKGVDILAAAVAHLNRCGYSIELVLAGDGRFVPEVQSRQVRQELARSPGSVTELGWIARDEFFSRVDLVVAPSRGEESFGLVAAEAMAARVPLVISDIGALREVAGPKHAWVARAGDAGDLADVIADAIDTDTRATATASRLRWEAEYSPEAGQQRLADVLRHLGVLPDGVGD